MSTNPARRLYRRLTWTSFGLVARSSLWLADDHFMQVQSTGVQESYQRFYFADVRAVLVSGTDRFAILNAVFIAGLLIAGIPTLYAWTNGTRPVVGVVFTVLLLVPLIVNLSLGGTCRVDVITGVQTTRLHSLSRRHKARRILAKIGPRITAAQRPPPPPAEPAPPPLAPVENPPAPAA